jgi:hypothetical protein
MSLSVENELKASAGMAPVRAEPIWIAPERARSPDGAGASPRNPGNESPDFAPASRALHPGYSCHELLGAIDALG